MSVGASFLTKIKTAAGITASTFDTDISDLIESARAEMVRIGVEPVIAVSETDALIRRAVRTFVQSEYAENEAEATRLSDSFKSQANALTQSTGYMADNSEAVTETDAIY